MPVTSFGPEFGYLKIDSDVRERELRRVIKRAYRLDVDIPDDRLTQVLLAQCIAEGDVSEEKSLDVGAAVRAIVERRKRERPTLIPQRLIEARDAYEAFFVGDLPRNVPGWNDDLIEIALSSLERPALIIAVRVWAADRGQALRKFTPSVAVAPPLEFDHSIIGYGKYVPLTRRFHETEPFFEVSVPAIGICGVSRAWMYLDSDDVNRYGAELMAFYKAKWPEAYDFVTSIDAPVKKRPLGFHSIPIAAEAFSRHLTIEEGAEFLLEQLSELNRMNRSYAV